MFQTFVFFIYVVSANILFISKIKYQHSLIWSGILLSGSFYGNSLLVSAQYLSFYPFLVEKWISLKLILWHERLFELYFAVFVWNEAKDIYKHGVDELSLVNHFSYIPIDGDNLPANAFLFYI